MNIDKFKHQHTDILGGIARLRALVRGGIAANAAAIATTIIEMSGTIRLHLSVEDRVLYPALGASGNAALAQMSQRYQAEMQEIAGAYLAFARRWNGARQLCEAPEAFRAEANSVLRTVYERMRKEDTEFYPAVEANFSPA